MSNTVMKEIQHTIRVRTAKMDSVEYAIFLRELAKWTQIEAVEIEEINNTFKQFIQQLNSI